MDNTKQSPHFKILIASILRQISHLYMITGKTIALTIWTFVGKVMSQFFNTLSGFIRAFFPRSNHPLISRLWLQSSVILEPKKTQYVTASTFPPSICHKVMGMDVMILAWHGS